MRGTFAVALFVLFALAAPGARAQAAPAAPSPAAPGAESSSEPAAEPATRRSGFTFGVAGGVLVGTAVGYPNEYGKIGNPAWRARASGVGGGGEVWIGGALADWFSFGIGSGGGGFDGRTMKSSGGGFVFRVETFPLFGAGGAWRDAGVLAEFGTGFVDIRTRSGDVERASGPGISIVGGGLFWEPWRMLGGHVTTGPAVFYQYQFMDGMQRHVAILGVRSAFYGGP